MKFYTRTLAVFLISIFSLIPTFGDEKFKVIKIIDGDTVYVDFNKNGMPEQNDTSFQHIRKRFQRNGSASTTETGSQVSQQLNSSLCQKVRLNGIDTFETKPSIYSNYQMKNYGFTQDEVLGLGYYGKEFAKKKLLNKEVIAVYSANTERCDMGRRLMSIYYDCKTPPNIRQGGINLLYLPHPSEYCKSYEKEVLKEGLATVYEKSNLAGELKQYENLDKIKANAKKSHRLNLVLLNKKNGKYHKPTCEYAFMGSDIELITPNKKYNKSGCCFQTKSRKLKDYKHKAVKYRNDLNVYFVNPTKNEYPKNNCTTKSCKALLKLIYSADDSIDFALYGFNEQDDILKALILAQQRGVKIRGVVDKDEIKTYRDTDKLKEKFKDVKVDSFISIAKKEQSDKFTRATHALMHNKFIIVDKKVVWTGSTNLSASCMTFNANNSVIINSSEVANIYTKEFEQMFVNSKFHTDKELLSNTENIKLNKGKTDVSIYFSPKSEALTNHVRPLISEARKSIYISMFFLTHRKIVEDLINAHNRGIDVKIILDGNFVADGYSPHQKLRDAKIPVKIENWKSKMHMKTAVFDEEISILGSTNWTSTAELVNDENMLIVKDKKIAQNLKKNFEQLWKLIPDEWLYLTPEFRYRPQR